jgi:hypothetical protein
MKACEKTFALVCSGVIVLGAGTLQRAAFAATPDELFEIVQRGQCLPSMRAYKPISYTDYCTPEHSNPAECKNEVDGFNQKIMSYNSFVHGCREARRREDERSYAQRRRERMRAAKQETPGPDTARASGGAGGTTIRAQSEPEKPAQAAAGEAAVRSADSTERPRTQGSAGCVGYAQRFTYVDGSGNSVTDICFRDKCCGPTR